MNRLQLKSWRSLLLESLLWSCIVLSLLVWFEVYFLSLNVITEVSVKGLGEELQKALKTRAQVAVLLATGATVLASICSVWLYRRHRTSGGNQPEGRPGGEG